MKDKVTRVIHCAQNLKVCNVLLTLWILAALSFTICISFSVCWLVVGDSFPRLLQIIACESAIIGLFFVSVAVMGHHLANVAIKQLTTD